MQSKDNQARPTVLRELSLLRALGASLRTPRRPGALRRPVPLKPLPQPDAFALLARQGDTALATEKRQ